jgi:hypothetical protein
MQTKGAVPEQRPPVAHPRVIRCSNCDIEVREGVVRDGNAYCCEGCAIGGPCTC